VAYRCRRMLSADPHCSSDRSHRPPTIHRSTRSTRHKTLYHRSFAHPKTHDDDLDVARRLAIARRVQIDVQTNGDLGQRNTGDGRLLVGVGGAGRGVESVVDVARRIVESQAVSLDVRAGPERERLDIDADAEIDDDGEEGVVERWK
jgi:hypothetical protein